MRILLSALSCHDDLGSEGSVGFYYAAALAQGHQVTVLASEPTRVPNGVRLVNCEAGPCSFNEVDAVSLSRFELRQWRLAKQLHAQQPFDYLHRVTPSALQLPTLASLLNIPTVVGPVIAATTPPPAFAAVLARAVTPPQHGRLHPQRIAVALSRRAVERLGRSQWHLRQAAHIIVGSELARHQLPQACQEKSWSLPYAGVEHQKFLPAARPPARKTRLLFVGRLVPYKGVELLLRALALVARKSPMQLDLIGAGDVAFEHYCRQLTDDLGLARQVNFIGHMARAELPSWYRQADIFCFPTLCDTYGLALLEAMSSGCAVITSQTGGAGEIVVSGTGITIALTDPERYVHDYAAALIELAASGERRAQMGAAARHHIIANHDWEKIGARLREFYAALEVAPRA